MGAGILFGVLQVQPVPAIILAQALNGVILPVVAIFLLLMVNNTQLLEPRYVNGNIYNGLMSIVVFITILLGVRNVLKVLSRLSGIEAVNESWMIGIAIAVSVICFWPLYRAIKRLHKA